jgi:synaptobrevin family protein YKT6
MKIYSIIVFLKKEDANLTIHKSSFYLKDVSFFIRSNVKEFLTFLSKTVATNAKNQKLRIVEKEHAIYIDSDNEYIYVIATDLEYNMRAAFSIMSELSKEINDKNFDLDKTIEKYQNPEETDKILKIQKMIDQSKIVMLDNIDKVLARGEKIDDLIVKSSDLSMSSKEFYKEAKKANSWCSGCVIA